MKEKVSQSLLLAKQFLGQKVKITIDRPLGSTHLQHDFTYEVNYGFIDGVKAPDGEDLDAYVLGVNKPLREFSGLCVAIAHRQDDDDDKLIVTSENILLSDEEIIAAIDFQEKWFQTEIIR